jgi:hypothetical protein
MIGVLILNGILDHIWNSSCVHLFIDMYIFATFIELLLKYSHKSNFDGKIRCSSLANLNPRQICY